MMDHDDFPLSPERWADASAYFQAFLKAEEFLAAIPAKSRGSNPDRLLSQITSDLYSSREQPATLLRAAPGAAEAGAAVWLSKVRTLAHWVTASVPVPAFQGLLPSDLRDFARMSVNVKQLPDLTGHLLQRGIVLIHESAIPGAKVDGAVFKLAGGVPVIGLSLRYPRLDHYWFTLMHELAHIALHSEHLDSPIIDDLDADRPDLVERQADRLAGNSFIPAPAWRSCPARYSQSERDIVDFAAGLGIAPQIVAGRLRRELGRHDLFSGLINQVNVREIIFGQD